MYRKFMILWRIFSHHFTNSGFKTYFKHNQPKSKFILISFKQKAQTWTEIKGGKIKRCINLNDFEAKKNEKKITHTHTINIEI